jgi:hypothetical protein
LFKNNEPRLNIMVWKSGQSGNPNGRPRTYLHLPKDPKLNASARYHIRNGVPASEFETDNTDFKREAQQIRQAAQEQHLEDPVLFQHRLLANDSLPLGLRATIAAAISPYYHPKLGISSPPRFIEVDVAVPDFQSIEEAQEFLADLSKNFAAGEIGAQSALDLSTLVRNWISARHATEELELKRLAASASTAPNVIHIEGGLPDLPGTNIIMPEPLTPSEVEAIDVTPALQASPAPDPTE